MCWATILPVRALPGAGQRLSRFQRRLRRPGPYHFQPEHLRHRTGGRHVQHTARCNLKLDRATVGNLQNVQSTGTISVQYANASVGGLIGLNALSFGTYDLSGTVNDASRPCFVGGRRQQCRRTDRHQHLRQADDVQARGDVNGQGSNAIGGLIGLNKGSSTFLTIRVEDARARAKSDLARPTWRTCRPQRECPTVQRASQSQGDRRRPDQHRRHRWQSLRQQRGPGRRHR